MPVKKDPLDRKPQDKAEAKLLADVKRVGWHLVGVMADENGPAFVYTVGLYHHYQHPEIVGIGLDIEVMGAILNGIGDKIKNGEKFANAQEADDILEGYLACFRTVDKQYYRDYFGFARWFYNSDDFPVLQCVWPDKARRYPWHPEAVDGFRKRQPILSETASERTEL